MELKRTSGPDGSGFLATSNPPGNDRYRYYLDIERHPADDTDGRVRVTKREKTDEDGFWTDLTPKKTDDLEAEFAELNFEVVV